MKSLIERIKENDFKHGKCRAVCIQDIEDEILEYFESREVVNAVGDAIHDAWHKEGTSVQDVARAAIKAILGEI